MLGAMTATLAAPVAALRTELSVMGTPGKFTYDVPAWCDRLDIVMLSGGDGGNVGPVNAGDGGQAGLWSTLTVNRADPEWSDRIQGVVGAGGARGTTLDPPTAGEPSTVNVALPPVGVHVPAATKTFSGDSPGNIIFNGQFYVGGAQQDALGQHGFAPGGGGAGVLGPYAAAGYGAAGAVWFFAQQTSPRVTAAYKGAACRAGGGAFPAKGYELAQYDSPGLYDYIIPWWCTALDVVTLSGGAGGDGGGTAAHVWRAGADQHGRRGAQGRWDARTLVRGRDVSWYERSVRVFVGRGGLGGLPGAAGTDGEESFAGYGSLDVFSAGGVGWHAHRTHAEARPPGSLDFHNAALGVPANLFTAGAAQHLACSTGNAPGGGGGGGDANRAGGDGAPGKVWIVAYQAAGARAAAYRGWCVPGNPLKSHH